MARSTLLDNQSNTDLRNHLGQGGYAQPARYEVIITPPSGYRGSGSASSNLFGQSISNNRDITRKVSLEMSQVAFPGMELETKEDVNLYGPTRNKVVGQTFANITTSVRVSTDFRERNFFDDWQRIAANRNDFSVGYYDDYVGSMQIFQLDKQNNRTHGVELVECFPSVVGELASDYANTNAIHLLSVTWTYRYWKNLNDEAEYPTPLVDRVNTGEFRGTVERTIRSQIPATLRRL